MRKLISVCTAMLILLLSAVAFANTDISRGAVIADGIGAPGQVASNGYRAAKVDAMRNLLEQVSGVRIDSETIVRDSILESDVIKTKINGIVRGAKVVRRYVDEVGCFHVEMELPVYGETNSLASAVIPRMERVSFPEPEVFAAPPVQPSATATAITSTAVTNQDSITTPKKPPYTSNTMSNKPSYVNKPAVTANYTGVIVDCQGLGLETAMAPAIFGPNHKMVYGVQNFSHEQVIANGYVGYSKSVSSGVERAGSNPLIIKAVSVEGFCSPVISDKDAAMLLEANKKTGFLSKGNVVLVK